MSDFGLPYMGSKDGIIESIVLNFPPATHFYDLFGGGFSVTHYMLEKKSHRYQYFHYNEIKADIVELVKKATNGDYNYNVFKPPWVSRKDFFANLDDAYVRICWSFGNNQKGYLFGEAEEYKRSMHMAVVFGEFNALASEVLGFSKWPECAKTIKQRRLYLRQKVEFYRKTKIPKVLYQFLNEKQLKQMNEFTLDNLRRLKQLRQLQELQQLQRLERLQQLQQLERLERLSCTSKDYREVEILPNSVVYCDIPYGNTADYGSTFNRKEFFDWAASRSFPVFISEYNVEDTRFQCVYKIDKLSLLSSTKSDKTNVEKLYWNGVKNEASNV